MVSLIVPVLQDEARLAVCLDDLLPQAALTRSEVLVVDGGSTDGSAELARSRPRVRLLTSRPGRGEQMNTGAHAALGSLLAFVPADTRLPPGAVELLVGIDRAGRPSAGGFRQKFDSPRVALRVVSALHNLRSSITGVFYGDQVPFVRRDLFHTMGGFRRDAPMEDVEFGARLRRRVRTHALPLVVETSARRFDRYGDLRTVAEAARLLFWWTCFRRIPRSEIFFEPVRDRSGGRTAPGGGRRSGG